MRRRTGSALIAAAVAVCAGWASPAEAHQAQAKRDTIAPLVRAQGLETEGAYEAAAMYYRKAVSTDTVAAILGLERVFDAMGQLERLTPILNTVLKDQPRNRLLRATQFRVLRALDKTWAISLAVDQWLRAAPDDPKA